MTIGRTEFLNLSWAEQKKTDLRKVLDVQYDVEPVDLTANCIIHKDDSASMVIYANGVWCFGCKTRMWPDVFLELLGDRKLSFERGTRKQPAPTYIPFNQVATYSNWLLSAVSGIGHYHDRMQWLLGRGLTHDTLAANYIGHSSEAFTIPIFDEARNVKAIRYRRDDALCQGVDSPTTYSRPKYWGTSGANAAMLYVPRRFHQTGYDNTKYGLILCEGELDALRLAQEGYAAVSLTNGCNALKEEHIPELRHLVSTIGSHRVTICYDQDEPGRKAARAALALLRPYIWAVEDLEWNPSLKDVTEYLVARAPAGEFAVLLGQLWR